MISQTDANNRTHSFHYDGLGSTRLLSDDSGNVSDRYSYAAFGELLYSSGDTDNNYLFTGEQFDDSVDNYYLRARYYDPDLGRFTQQDKWVGRDGEPVTLNKYLYTHADPVNGTDPSGYTNLTSLGVAQSGQGVLIQSAHRHVFVKAFKNMGCELGFALAEETIRHGIYVLYDSISGRYYVGKSEDIDGRHKDHLRQAKKEAQYRWKKHTQIIARFFVHGGGDALAKMEQFIMDILEADGHNLRNINKAIGDSPDRDKIRKDFRQLKKAICK